MFSNISWSTYFAVLAVSSAAYYLYIGIRYFSGSIKEKLSPTPKRRMRTDFTQENYHSGSEPFVDQQDNNQQDESALTEYGDIEDLIERINNTIAGASERNADTLEIKEYLKLLFSEYPSLKNSPFRSSINEMVASEYNKLGKVALSDEEVDLLWDAV